MRVSSSLPAVLFVVGLAACQGDFLTGGELSTDPNRSQTASNKQLFVGVQSNIFYSYNGDMVRIAGVFAQHVQPNSTAGSSAYTAYDAYEIDEHATNQAERQLYGPGGLADVRRLQQGTAAAHDSLFLGIAQVQEAMLMGLAADVFGDLVYTHALTGEANPPLDKQLAVLDSLQVLLSKAISNMSSTAPSSVGPKTADLVYGGHAAKWIALAHTLKARFYMHTAEVRGTTAYQQALAEAQLGIQNASGDYKAVFSGNALESNPWYQFQRSTGNIITAGRTLDTLLRSRSDPRRSNYFHINTSTNLADGLSSTRLDSSFAQPIVTAAENHLIWAEAAFAGSATATALAQLNSERVAAGLKLITISGSALLQEILTEEYINDFQLGVEGWKMYRRTCFPNLPNRSSGQTLPMPGRLYYDPDERSTDTNIPAPGVDPNGIRNQDDPANATSVIGGGACLAGA